MNIFNSKKRIQISTSLKNISKDSVTLIIKKIIGNGKYRVYVNGWKYNLTGYPIRNEVKHQIEGTYFQKGENRIEIVILDSLGKKRQVYEQEFLVA